MPLASAIMAHHSMPSLSSYRAHGHQPLSTTPTCLCRPPPYPKRPPRSLHLSIRMPTHLCTTLYIYIYIILKCLSQIYPRILVTNIDHYRPPQICGDFPLPFLNKNILVTNCYYFAIKFN